MNIANLFYICYNASRKKDTKVHVDKERPPTVVTYGWGILLYAVDKDLKPFTEFVADLENKQLDLYLGLINTDFHRGDN